MKNSFIYSFILLQCFLYPGALLSTNVTLYTPNGSEVYGFTRAEELSQAQKNQIWITYANQYPDATVIGEPTTTYNCHSYAWNMVNGGQTCWLNSQSYQPTSNMNKYWTDGSYVETTVDYCEKVYWYGTIGAHSATRSTVLSGNFVSKWGEGPLMEHILNDCPDEYLHDYQRYYARYPNISGHSIISNTYYSTFRVNCIPKNTTLSWSYDTSKFTEVSSSGTNIKLKPKTTSTVGVGTLTANFKNSSGTVLYSCSYAIYINRLPSISVQSLRVVRSSDGVEVYPSYVGLCPNTFYYAYITGTSPSFSYNWDMNHAMVYSSSYGQAYFQTDSQGWTFLDLYATDTTANITEQIYGVTLYGGDSCN